MQSALELLYFNLFDDCNARCNMCGCWLEPFLRRDVSFYLRRLDQVLALRPHAIRFTGGEPLLLKGLPALVSRAASTGARVSVISNGRLLRAKAQALADAGSTEIVVSLDGVGATHDEIRGTPGLFAHCLNGIAAVCDTSMSYGVNTVIQRAGADQLPELADTLLAQPKPPQWWHLIPIRDNAEILPTDDQRARLPRTVGAIRDRMATHDVTVVADDTMFSDHGPAACCVPSFTAYLRADTGDVFGCNMLAYVGGSIGNIDSHPPERVWASPSAAALRQRCADGVNPACLRCDPGSRAANHMLRKLATAHARAGNR